MAENSLPVSPLLFSSHFQQVLDACLEQQIERVSSSVRVSTIQAY